ncbi:hypothetical protein J3L16_05315, partial [Alteromonas sp. 5E99-2]|uniref:thioesterase domain-containing protein n=1 Tax=Alteromonas sp. 5E99-2 TaxID=2817683 RepID=UPI001ACB5634
LPAPELANINTYEAPEGDTEIALAGIWQEVLGVEQVGRHDNFFMLGGNSLLSLQVVSKFKLIAQTHEYFSLKELMLNPTIASVVNHSARNKSIVLMNTIVTQTSPLFCIHGGMGTSLVYQDIANQLNGIMPVYGIACRTINDLSHIDTSLEQMAMDYCHMIQEVQPKGPYHILGWSLGAPLAVMVSGLLEAKSHRVSFLGLVDSFEPNKKNREESSWKRSFIHDLVSFGFNVNQGQIFNYLADKNVLSVALIKKILIECNIVENSNKVRDVFNHEDYVAIFMATYNLRLLSNKPIDLPFTSINPSCWWAEDKTEKQKLSLIKQLGSLPRFNSTIASNHYGIIQHKQFLLELTTELQNVIPTLKKPLVSMKNN